MTYDDIMSTYETQRAAAAALGVSKQAISKWKRTGIPRNSQIEIEVRTRGKFRADLPKQLRAA